MFQQYLGDFLAMNVIENGNSHEIKSMREVEILIFMNVLIFFKIWILSMLSMDKPTMLKVNN
jgi:hypothetical protein